MIIWRSRFECVLQLFDEYLHLSDGWVIAIHTVVIVFEVFHTVVIVFGNVCTNV